MILCFVDRVDFSFQRCKEIWCLVLEVKPLRGLDFWSSSLACVFISDRWRKNNISHHLQVLNACDVASNMARFDGIEFGHRSKNAGKSTNALYAATRHEGFNEVVRGRILAGNFFLLRRNYKQYFVRAAQLRRLIAADFSSAFEAQVDIILAPVTLTAAPTFEEFSSVDNRTQQEVQDLFTVGSSLAGLPAITVPIAMSKLGLPLSMQLIASFRDDYFLLDVARSLQKLFSFSINQP